LKLDCNVLSSYTYVPDSSGNSTYLDAYIRHNKVYRRREQLLCLLSGSIRQLHPLIMSALQDFETFDTAGLSSNGFPSLTNMAVYDMVKHSQKLPPHSSHPDFGHLTVLVFQAVLEVVFVALPGYIVARQGMFDAEAQKFAANLNVQLFTPCLSTSTFDFWYQDMLTMG
jgi:hypothetical protein